MRQLRKRPHHTTISKFSVIEEASGGFVQQYIRDVIEETRSPIMINEDPIHLSFYTLMSKAPAYLTSLVQGASLCILIM